MGTVGKPLYLSLYHKRKKMQTLLENYRVALTAKNLE